MAANSPDRESDHFDRLRRFTHLEVAAGDLAGLKDTCEKIVDWPEFTASAERHGLAPLIYRHAREYDLPIPNSALLDLKALVIRHRHANSVRFAVLSEMLETFSEHGIKVVVLKGAALANMIFPDPALRPMRDLDILVHPEQTRLTQSILRDHDFTVPEIAQTRYMRDHHHLPNASCQRDGLTVSLEIHVDALSRDAPGSICLDKLSCPLQSFELDARSAYALGHQDMLRHLCHHLLEPARHVRLINVVDLSAYAAFFSDVDWPAIRQDWPFVINTIKLLHFLTPLPAALQQELGRPQGPPPQGIGRGFLPLSRSLRRSQGWPTMLQDLFNPPEWWLRAYYKVPNPRPLFWCRVFRHPARLGYWLLRRFRAHLPQSG